MPRKSKSAAKKAAMKIVNKSAKAGTPVVNKGAMSVTKAIPIVNRTVHPKPFMKVAPVEGQGLDLLRVQGLDVISRVGSTSSFSNFFDENVNPLNPAMFPKLSAIAALYEKYKLGGGGLRIHYFSQCPTSTSGLVASYLETDVADTVGASGVIDVINQEFSASSAAYESFSYYVPPSIQSQKWLYTQRDITTEAEGDRTMSLGYLKFYTELGSSSTVFLGFIAIEYDFVFSVFRPPTSVGFVLVNNTDVALTSGVTKSLELSDEKGSSIGARAARYIWDGFTGLSTSGSGLGNPDSYYLRAPAVGKTAGAVTYQVGAATAEDEKKAKGSSGLKRELETFCPVEVKQDPETLEWFYQELIGGPWLPYSQLKRVAQPLAIGDITFYITSTNSAGTQTVLYSVTVNDVAALAQSIVYSIIPAEWTVLKFGVNAIFTTARAVDWIRNIVAPLDSTLD